MTGERGADSDLQAITLLLGKPVIDRIPAARYLPPP